MKIAIFIADSNGGYPVPASKGGAVSTLVEHLVSQNNKKNHVKMTIISMYDKKAEEMSRKYNNIEFIWVKSPRIIQLMDKFAYFTIRKLLKKKKTVSYRSLFSLIWYILIAKNVLGNNAYDKVILENNIPLAWIIKLSKYKGEYYYHFHNIPRINAKCKSVFEKCNGYLCVSDFVANEISTSRSPIGPISKDRICTLYNCIDTKLFKNKFLSKQQLEELNKKYSLSTNDRIILFVGRLSEEKGADKILEALPYVNTPNVKLLIVGSLIYDTSIIDDYQMKLIELSKKVADEVVFTGFVNQEDLPALYSVAEIAVLPSMWDEPAGLTMIEAMACGSSVITTASGGIPEYVGTYATVLKKDENLVNNLAKSIDKLLSRSPCDNNGGVVHINNSFSNELYLENFLTALYNF